MNESITQLMKCNVYTAMKIFERVCLINEDTNIPNTYIKLYPFQDLPALICAVKLTYIDF